jgi:heme/copper-type cytochrome/quinol oxidase subunit 1
MKKPIKLSRNTNLRNIIIILVAIIFGFVGGLLFSYIRTNYASNSTTTLTPSTQICNCPNIPVGANPTEYCKC